MRQLHVLGVSDDGDALLLGTATDGSKPTHRIPLDDKLRAVVRGQLSAVVSDRSEIALAPKEIQARLRAGDTPEEVAKAAQVPVARVLPYAAPVIAERERIIEQARAAVLHRHRGPNGERPLGDLVDLRLSETPGLRSDTVEWTARRRQDGAWIVTLAYAARGGRRRASWLWRPVDRDLTALDVSGSRLAAEDSGSAPRRRRSTGSGTATARPKPAARKKTGPAKKKTAGAKKKAAARKATAKKAPARKSIARKAPAKRPVVKKAVVKKAPAAKRPVAKKAAAATKTVRKATATKRVAKPAARKPRAEPRPAPMLPSPAATHRGAHVPLPSWSDVLLGVQATTPRETAARQATPARRRRKA